MPDAKNTTAKPRKLIDVTAPGKSTPPSSGRPIIVSNRPVLKQDPMVVPLTEPTETTDNKPVSRVSKPIKIVPLSDDDDASLTLKSAPTPTKASDDTLETAPDPVVKTPPKTPKKQDTEEKTPRALTDKPPQPSKNGEPGEPPMVEVKKPESSQAPIDEPKDEAEETSTADGQLAPNQALEDVAKKQAEEKAALTAEQEKIIESKKYFLPINTVEKRRLNQRALLVLILVIFIALAWLDIVLDAGILKLGNLQPLTHFFNS